MRRVKARAFHFCTRSVSRIAGCGHCRAHVKEPRLDLSQLRACEEEKEGMMSMVFHIGECHCVMARTEVLSM